MTLHDLIGELPLEGPGSEQELGDAITESFALRDAVVRSRRGYDTRVPEMRDSRITRGPRVRCVAEAGRVVIPACHGR